MALPVALVVSAIILTFGMIQLGKSMEKAGSNARSPMVNVPSSLSLQLSPGAQPLHVELKQPE